MKKEDGEKKGGGGVSDSWLDVRKRGGGIHLRTVCKRGGGGRSKNWEKLCM